MAMPVIERAAPRWVNWRSILWAMERSISDSSTAGPAVLASTIGATCTSTSRLPVRGPSITMSYSCRPDTPSARPLRISSISGLS